MSRRREGTIKEHSEVDHGCKLVKWLFFGRINAALAQVYLQVLVVEHLFDLTAGVGIDRPITLNRSVPTLLALNSPLALGLALLRCTAHDRMCGRDQ